MIEAIQQGLREDGFDVPIAKLCRWFDVPRRTFYYRPTKAPLRLQDQIVEPIKAMIEEHPSSGYRTVAWLLGNCTFTAAYTARIGSQSPRQ